MQDNIQTKTEEVRFIQAITVDNRVVSIPVYPGQSITEAINDYFGR